jgi:4-amino-4-deoxy-L-arabinose transferase-like glycosyltransferase
MAFFGESILVVRIFGVFCVFISSVIVFLITRKSFNFFFSIISAFFCVPMMFIYWNGQTTFTEHIAIPFILLVTYLCIKDKNICFQTAAGIGLLISLAAMVRLNLAHVSIPVSIIILFYSNRSSILGKGLTGAVYAVSAIVPLLILVFYYTYIDELDTLYKSMITVHFSYAAGQASIISVLGSFIDEFINPDGWLFLSFKNLIFITALIGGVIVLFDLKEFKDHKQIKLLIFCIAVVFSVSASGATYRHYLLQLAPFIVIFSAFSLSKLSRFQNTKYLPVGAKWHS